MAAAATVVRKVSRVPRARRRPWPRSPIRLPLGDAAILEGRLADGMGCHQFQPLGVVEAGGSTLDDESRQAAAALPWIGLGEHGVGGGVARLADEFLAPVQHPVIAVGDSLGAHADDVGAGLRLGEGEGGD